MASSTKFVRRSYENWGESYEISGQLRNGLPDGKWVKLKGRDTVSVSNFLNGKRQGFQMEIVDEWTGDARTEIYESTETSVTIYDAISKSVKKHWEIKNGVRDGKYEFYSSGKLYLTGTYRNGKMEGKWTRWHEDRAFYSGTIRTVTNYVHDVLINEIWVDESGNEIKH